MPNINNNRANRPTIDIIRQNLARRKRTEWMFRTSGKLAIGFAVICLLVMLTQIIWHGRAAFYHSYVSLPIHFSKDLLEIADPLDARQISLANYEASIRHGLEQIHAESDLRLKPSELYSLVSNGAVYQLQKQLTRRPELFNDKRTVRLLVDDDLDMYLRLLKDKGETGRLSSDQIRFANYLLEQEKLRVEFNPNFFFNGDSRDPELAGLGSAIVGSFYSLCVCFAIALPLGIGSALYLELYAPQNAFTRLIEININNLAAVPSIVFGLLGLAIFINFFGLPKAWPVVGGMVLALMTLPTIIIASRAAIRAVPKGIIEGAEALGASKMQVILDHIIPHAMPGILTGTIIGLAQALGETAPLLLIGMVAFIVDIPGSISDPATALPVQIFLWSDSPERAFLGKTAGAILVLLIFLVLMNLSAIILRRKFERKNASR